MFNTNVLSSSPVTRNIVSTHINAVSGTLSKTYVSSFFKTVSLTDPVFSDEPHIVKKEYCRRGDGWDGYWNDKKHPVVVIQTMLVGDGKALVELMFDKDYKELMEEIR